MKLRYTTVHETGGMKGRREELTREEIHKFYRLHWESKIYISGVSDD